MLFSALGVVTTQCTASLNGQDARPDDVPKGALPGLGVCQRLFACLLLLSFRSLSTLGEGNGGVVGLEMFHVAKSTTALST